MRKIIHVDMDAFYASVEQRDNPALKGRPVVVGGKPASRGVVAAASYEARRYGIHSAMPCAQAARRCPDAIFVPPRFPVYRDVSRQLHQIFRAYSTLVEPLGLDEAYLDVTVNTPGYPYASTVAKEIRQCIESELGLTASAGVGPNKYVAKLASDHNKPNGLVVVQPHEVLDFISDLPVGKLWGVGPAMATKLHAMGLSTVAEVRECTRLQMEQALGAFGRFIRELAHGRDPRSVQPRRPARSRGAETTFPDNVSDVNALREVLRDLASRVSMSLSRVERPARTVSVKVRYDSFETVTRAQTLGCATWDAEEIWNTACVLLGRTEAGTRPVRLVGISASNLYAGGEAAQLELPLDV